MSERPGLVSLMESVKIALRGGGFEEVSRSSRRFREALAETLVDPLTLGDKRIVEAYMERVRGAVELLARALHMTGFSTDTAPIAARVIAGLALVDDEASCVLVILRSSVEIGGAVYEPGELLCVDARLAITLSSAGLLEIVQPLQGFVAGEG